MKISESTSYPHPVLAPWSSDIAGAVFETAVTYREDEQSNQLSIHCTVTLDQPEILSLIQTGVATFGCLIRCQETGLRRLQALGFPSGNHDFAAGALLGRVQIRPLIWTIKDIEQYQPAGTHEEFPKGLYVSRGQILALDEEKAIDVTRPPLPAMESIFEIKSSEELPEGQFDLDLDQDRILVRMGVETYKLVQELRGTDSNTKIVVMNSLYVPVIMEVLGQLKERKYDSFESYRWLHPFRARCEMFNVDIEKPELLNDAQKLLASPFATLRQLSPLAEEQQ